MENKNKKSNLAITATKQTKRPLLNLTENQLKVIKDKYLKDSPTPEAWLDLVTSNIALGDILYLPNIPEKEIFDGVNVKIIEKQIGEGKTTKLYLLHHGLETHNERAANFKKFLSNLQKLAAGPGYKDQYEKTREEFYSLLSSFKFLPNSPTLMNAGRVLQQLSACYVLPVEDSIEGIYDSVKNMAAIHQSGGGTGFSFSKLRPARDVVNSTKGISSGPISFMQLFDKSTDVVKQGGTRRGANMGILIYNHPNIMDFINMKKTPGIMENFNVSVAITDEFMQKVKKGEEYDLINPRTQKPEGKLNAKKVWDELVKGAWETGDPGIIIIDRINNTDSNPTPQIGQIESTNPCVTGDTLISTEHGLMRMEELVQNYPSGGIAITTDNRIPIKVQNPDGTVMLLEQNQQSANLREISQAFYSGIKPVYKLLTKSGYELEATADHKIFTTKGKKKLIELKPGEDKVLIQSDEISFNSNSRLPFDVENKFIGDNGRKYTLNLPQNWSKELGQTLGWLIGDGWLGDKDENCRVGFTFSQEDRQVLDYLKPIINNYYDFEVKEVLRENKVFHLSYHSRYFVDFFKKLGVKPADADKKEVPKTLFTAPKEAVIGFLQALFTADGTAARDAENGNYYIRLTSKSKTLLKQAQILLINIGIKSRIYDRSRKERKVFNYTKVNGEFKEYTSDGILYELNISRDNLPKFVDKIGFLFDKQKENIHGFKEVDFTKELFADKIKSIEYIGEKKVYDLTEPITHSFICNSIVVSNCGEQPLLPYEPCNLGSINLSKFIDENKKDFDWQKLKECVYTAVHFLDNVIDVNNYPIAKIEELAKGNRRIGLGVMGWAEALVMLQISYNSEQAYQKARQLMKFINDVAREKSCELARERGVFPNFKDSIFDKTSPNFRKGHDFRPRHCARTTIAPTGTIGITAGLQGAGIEPFFAVVYTRYNAAAIDALKKGETPAEKDVFYEINPLFKKLAEKNNYFGLKPQVLWQKIDQNHKSLVGIKQIPKKIQDLFLTSHDLSPQDHIRVQAAFQEFTDNAVSKTVNFKNEATIKDIEDVYHLAYSLGCKGVTVYRDGSKSLQVLNVSTPKQQPNNDKGAQLTLNGKYIAPRQRPKVSVGTTEKLNTGQDNLYVTINEDENGLCEVFAHMGRSGGCTNAQTEALGRTISLALQSGVDPVQIAHQLRGIKCTCHAFFGKEPVLSIADGIGLAMQHYIARIKARSKEHFRFDAQPQQIQKDTNPKDFLISDETTECPECSYKLEYREGCLTCANCNYSKCG